MDEKEIEIKIYRIIAETLVDIANRLGSKINELENDEENKYE